MPGIQTSSIRQSASPSWSEFTNSSAEANVLTANPTDLTSPQSASRTDSSSSIIEIRGGSATQQTSPVLPQRSIIPSYEVAKGISGVAECKNRPAAAKQISGTGHYWHLNSVNWKVGPGPS